MILTIKENQKHKYIKVRARACSDCGKKSEWVEKKYYIDCPTAQLNIVPLSRKITYRKYDNIEELFPEVQITNNEECYMFFYEISDTEFLEVTTKSNISHNKKIPVNKFMTDIKDYLYLSVRAFCTKSETWKSEQENILLQIEKELLFTPSVYNADDNNYFVGYLQKGDYIRLCIPSVSEKTKIKYTLDGTDPKDTPEEYGEVIGDYIETPITFNDIGDFTIRAVSVINGHYSREKKQTIKVRQIDAILIDDEQNTLATSENKNYILGAI